MSKNKQFIFVRLSHEKIRYCWKNVQQCDEFDLDIADLDIADLDMGWSFRDVLDIVVVGHTGFGHKKLDIFVMTHAGISPLIERS